MLAILVSSGGERRRRRSVRKRFSMLSAEKVQSASGRGTAQAKAGSNQYRIVLPRLPTGKLVVDSVFLHADLAGRPYRAHDFTDALRTVVNLKEISSIG